MTELMVPRTSREYLVKHKFVGPGKVAINGGSNGGEPMVRIENFLRI